MKPILFNTEMVRAILEGRKTVTRRVVKPQPFAVKQDENAPCWYGHIVSESGKVLLDKPPYRPGDILYVRETWARGYIESSDAELSNEVWFEEYEKRDESFLDCISSYFYRSDFSASEEAEYHMKWRPSIHMPREAARIFLRVTDVRVERLQDITPDQIDAEGCKEWAYSAKTGELLPSGPSWFKIAWDNTLKPKDRALYGWQANPWVWVVEFERIGRDETPCPPTT